MFKKIMIHTRRGMKFIVLFMIAAFLIIGAVAFCGILLGKKLRDNKDAKTAANTDAE